MLRQILLAYDNSRNSEAALALGFDLARSLNAPLHVVTVIGGGGRPVLMATNVVFSAGLALLGSSQSVGMLFLAWAVLGIGMGSGLYEAAFAALVRLYGSAARKPITGITLLAGFASTVGWPLTAWLETNSGWRESGSAPPCG